MATSNVETLKLRLHDDVRRLRVQVPLSTTALRGLIATSFGDAAAAASIKFRDDEDDWCTVTNDEELQEAFAVARASARTKVLSLSLEVKPRSFTEDLAQDLPLGGATSTLDEVLPPVPPAQAASRAPASRADADADWRRKALPSTEQDPSQRDPRAAAATEIATERLRVVVAEQDAQAQARLRASSQQAQALIGRATAAAQLREQLSRTAESKADDGAARPDARALMAGSAVPLHGLAAAAPDKDEDEDAAAQRAVMESRAASRRLMRAHCEEYLAHTPAPTFAGWLAALHPENSTTDSRLLHPDSEWRAAWARTVAAAAAPPSSSSSSAAAAAAVAAHVEGEQSALGLTAGQQRQQQLLQHVRFAAQQAAAGLQSALDQAHARLATPEQRQQLAQQLNAATTAAAAKVGAVAQRTYAEAMKPRQLTAAQQQEIVHQVGAAVSGAAAQIKEGVQQTLGQLATAPHCERLAQQAQQAQAQAQAAVAGVERTALHVQAAANRTAADAAAGVSQTATELRVQERVAQHVSALQAALEQLVGAARRTRARLATAEQQQQLCAQLNAATTAAAAAVGAIAQRAYAEAVRPRQLTAAQQQALVQQLRTMVQRAAAAMQASLERVFTAEQRKQLAQSAQDVAARAALDAQLAITAVLDQAQRQGRRAHEAVRKASDSEAAQVYRSVLDDLRQEADRACREAVSATKRRAKAMMAAQRQQQREGVEMVHRAQSRKEAHRSKEQMVQAARKQAEQQRTAMRRAAQQQASQARQAVIADGTRAAQELQVVVVQSAQEEAERLRAAKQQAVALAEARAAADVTVEWTAATAAAAAPQADKPEAKEPEAEEPAVVDSVMEAEAAPDVVVPGAEAEGNVVVPAEARSAASWAELTVGALAGGVVGVAHVMTGRGAAAPATAGGAEGAGAADDAQEEQEPLEQEPLDVTVVVPASDVRVVEEEAAQVAEPEAQPAAAPVEWTRHGPMVGVPAGYPHTVALTVLHDMGFTDVAKCMRLLEQYGGNLPRVAAALLDQ